MKIFVFLIALIFAMSTVAGADLLEVSVSDNPKMDHPMTVFGYFFSEEIEFEGMYFYFNDDPGATYWTGRRSDSFCLTPRELWLSPGKNSVTLKQAAFYLT